MYHATSGLEYFLNINILFYFEITLYISYYNVGVLVLKSRRSGSRGRFLKNSCIVAIIMFERGLTYVGSFCDWKFVYILSKRTSLGRALQAPEQSIF
jgi:hypothetical protein